MLTVTTSLLSPIYYCIHIYYYDYDSQHRKTNPEPRSKREVIHKWYKIIEKHGYKNLSELTLLIKTIIVEITSSAGKI